MADVCATATEGTIDEISSFMGWTSATGREDDIRRRSSDGTAYSQPQRQKQQQQQQHQQPDYVEKSPMSETEESSFLGVFPSMIFSVTSDNTNKGSQEKNMVAKSRSQSTVTSISRIKNSSLNDDTDDDLNSNQTDQTTPSIMNFFSMVDDTSSSRSRNSQKKVKTVEHDIIGFPSIRNAFSMNDDVFCLNDIHIEGEELSNDNQKEENPKFLTSIRDVEKSDILLRPISQELQQRPPSNAGGSDKSTHKILVTRAYEVKEHYLESIFYISISAILGSIFRVYMSRIFSCEYKNVDDFLTAFTSNICVTNGGQSIQTGGALFIDFPSNVFGR